ncbi:MAG: hypothetical protein KAX24_01980 [Anaerolineae bacterium]|nr:hypothetical protein [Anaerolineae bacterium]
MEQNTGVVTAVICLWARAEKKLINELQTAAEAKGLRFCPDWSWQEAKEGFYAFEDIAPLAECTEALAQDRPSPEADHIRLAALWLSRALIPESSETTTEDSSPQFQEKSDEAELSSPQGAPGATEPSELEETLPVLSQSLQERVDGVDQARQAAVSKARTVLAAAEASDLAEAEAQLVILQDALVGWRSKQSALEEIAQQAAARLTNELEVRSDLDLDVTTSVLLGEGEPTGAVTKVAAKGLLSVLEHIFEYDREKRIVFSQ